MRASDPAVLSRCLEILAEAGVENDTQLAAELMQTVVRLAADNPGRAEMKLMLRSFKELRHGFKAFKPYRSRRKISMFGSARTAPGDPDYAIAEQFARLAAGAGFMVITGAGGGIMQAGNEGAGLAQSFGVAIKLPFEQQTNQVIAGDQKLIHFRYFFSRKLVFVKETHAVALFPGGFGTHDEGFEVLTLVQTGRCDPMPIVMVEHPGGSYWHAWDEFVRTELLGNGLISPDDTALYYITTDPAAAVRHVERFYRNYHSLRYIDDDLVLRIKSAPTPHELVAIAAEFADILSEGTIALRTAAEVEPDGPLPGMARLVFRFNRRSLARLRMMIDRLNSLESLAAAQPADAAEVGADISDRGVATIAEEESIKLAGPGT
ncbi:MAG TPA: LOG family protein [Armatimonadota bacterium]|nr:LOG family protein [Armatimonadota bacterium]